MLGVLGLLVVFAILYYTVWNVPPGDVPQATVDPTQDPMMKIIAVRGAIPKIPTEAVEEKYEWGKDLFATTMTIEVAELPEKREPEKREPEKQYNLTGIEFSKPSSASAIINGELVRIGDTLNDYKIIEITQNGVVLYGNGKRLPLTLGNGGSR